MVDKFPEVTLPNGIKINCFRKREALSVFKQVEEYLKNGIEVREGDTIFDIGANIGLFALWVSQKYNKNVTVFSFEPIPKIFKLLQSNVDRFGSKNLKAFNFGFSDERKEISFVFRPNATVMSTAYPDGWEEDFYNLERTINYKDKTFPLAIRIFGMFPQVVRSYVVKHLIRRFLKMERVVCQVRTISDFISDQNVEKIDLLKIDVEKSELDVFMGIEDIDWPKIKQVVVEVHDVDNRIEVIKGIFQKHGFNNVTSRQEHFFEGTNLYNLYARRE